MGTPKKLCNFGFNQPWIENSWEKKDSRKFQNHLEFAVYRLLFTNIYAVSGTINNAEMVKGRLWAVCGFLPTHIRNWSIPGRWYRGSQREGTTAVERSSGLLLGRACVLLFFLFMTTSTAYGSSWARVEWELQLPPTSQPQQHWI